MDFGSWFRFRSFLSKNHTKIEKSDQIQQQEERLGLTEELIYFIKSFTLDTFKNFQIQEEEEEGSVNNRNDLSEWQESHAVLVLSKVEEISRLRYLLCPRYLKDQQFWRIYFKLVKSFVSEYELQAIRTAKLKRMAIENANEKSSHKNWYEVEMAETKPASGASPPPLLDD